MGPDARSGHGGVRPRRGAAGGGVRRSGDEPETTEPIEQRAAWLVGGGVLLPAIGVLVVLVATLVVMRGTADADDAELRVAVTGTSSGGDSVTPTKKSSRPASSTSRPASRSRSSSRPAMSSTRSGSRSWPASSTPSRRTSTSWSSKPTGPGATAASAPSSVGCTTPRWIWSSSPTGIHWESLTSIQFHVPSRRWRGPSSIASAMARAGSTRSATGCRGRRGAEPTLTMAPELRGRIGRRTAMVPFRTVSLFDLA